MIHLHFKACGRAVCSGVHGSDGDVAVVLELISGLG